MSTKWILPGLEKNGNYQLVTENWEMKVKEIKWNFNQLLVSVRVSLGTFDVLYWVKAHICPFTYVLSWAQSFSSFKKLAYKSPVLEQLVL